MCLSTGVLYVLKNYFCFGIELTDMRTIMVQLVIIRTDQNI